MKTTARLSQWLAQNHVHIYHILETHGIIIFFFTLKHQLHSTEIIFIFFCSQAIEQICFNISARFQTNKYIHSSENGFIYKNTNMKLQSDKKKLNVFG